MSLSFLGFLLIFLKLSHTAASYPPAVNNLSFNDTTSTTLLRRMQISMSDTSLSDRDRTSSISSTNSSTNTTGSLTTNLSEILNQFLFEYPLPQLFDKRKFDVTQQNCWFEYFCMSKVPFYFTFLMLEDLLVLETETKNTAFFSFSLIQSRESKIIDSMFKGALIVYFKDAKYSDSSNFDIFLDLNMPNCYNKATIQ